MGKNSQAVPSSSNFTRPKKQKPQQRTQNKEALPIAGTKEPRQSSSLPLFQLRVACHLFPIYHLAGIPGVTKSNTIFVANLFNDNFDELKNYFASVGVVKHVRGQYDYGGKFKRFV